MMKLPLLIFMVIAFSQTIAVIDADETGSESLTEDRYISDRLETPLAECYGECELDFNHCVTDCRLETQFAECVRECALDASHCVADCQWAEVLKQMKKIGLN